MLYPIYSKKVSFVKTLFIFAVFVILKLNSFAQNNAVCDSLIYKLNNTVNDSIKVGILNELAWQFRKSNSGIALDYAYKAILIARQKDNKKGEATGLNRIGEIKRLSGKYHEAITEFKKALQIENKINNRYGIARAASQLSLIYKKTGNIDSAYIFGEQSLFIFIELNDEVQIANSYDRLAVLERDRGNLSEALKLFLESMGTREERADSNGLMYSYMNMANLYSKMSDHENSLKYNKKAKEIAVELNDSFNLSKVYTNISVNYYKLKIYDISINYNLRSIEIKKNQNLRNDLDANYTNLGNVYTDIGELGKAIEYYTKSIKLKKEKGELDDMPLVINNLGDSYFIQKEYKLALDSYKEAVIIATQIKNQLICIDLYQNIYKTYILLGDLKNAVIFNDKYINLRDSLDLSFKESIAIKENYNDEKKNTELLKKDKIIQDVDLRRKSIIIYSLIAGISLLCLLFFALFYNYRLKQKAVIAERNQKISEQTINDLLKNQELKSMSAMLKGQEGERKRIAQDLHDRLGSTLSMVKVHFKSVEEQIEFIKENNKKQYIKANLLLDEACDEVRKIAHDMLSGVLNKFGLIKALQELKESVESTGQLNLELLSFGFDENRLDYDIEINIYRIVQELLSNTLKHAKASDMSIQLIKKENKLNVIVEDDGIGFDINEVEKNSKGIGLRNIKARVDDLCGTLLIDSGKGVGTTISIDIPLNI